MILGLPLGYNISGHLPVMIPRHGAAFFFFFFFDLFLFSTFLFFFFFFSSRPPASTFTRSAQPHGWIGHANDRCFFALGEAGTID